MKFSLSPLCSHGALTHIDLSRRRVEGLRCIRLRHESGRVDRRLAVSVFAEGRGRGRVRATTAHEEQDEPHDEAKHHNTCRHQASAWYMHNLRMGLAAYNTTCYGAGIGLLRS